MIAVLVRIFFVWKGGISKRFHFVLNKDEAGESELSVYIALEYQRRYLYGGVKKVRKYEDDPILLDIVDKLRSIEHQIYIETRKAHLDYEDYQKVKAIIETITI